MKQLKFLSAAAAAALVLTLFTACGTSGSDDGGTKTVTIGTLDLVIEERATDVKFTPEFYKYREKLLKLINAQR